MKKEIYFLLSYVFFWMILIDIVGILININEDLLHNEIAEYLLFFSMIVFPFGSAWITTKLKLKKCRGETDGNQN